MENNKQENSIVELMYPDAYKTGIINEDGETLFVLEFGKSLAIVPIGDEDVEYLARIAVSPDDLRLLFDRILHIGLRYSPDFWNAFLSSGKDGPDRG